MLRSSTVQPLAPLFLLDSRLLELPISTPLQELMPDLGWGRLVRLPV